MTSISDKITSLQLTLESVTKRCVKNAREENSLRSLERSLNEEIMVYKCECEFMSQQMLDLKNEISHGIHQLSITEICRVSEKCKMENHLQSVRAFKQGFDDMYAREREISELQDKELQIKHAKEEEIELQKIAKILEINNQKDMEAVAIESECDAIDRECAILKKRNSAIMLKIRRQLLEAEDTRRERLRKN
ncbi:uncharacterized protein LOC112058022 [Bicyclus anynana]|uniref:Uncharacterized protein LOC112058022 n=1 Tax=Bicyclus anynana TaxID=110368 RepID=A0ABM3LX10_BICAN|nr:uncharacterized protein LOC112058022 [Bicyclus anynana]